MSYRTFYLPAALAASALLTSCAAFGPRTDPAVDSAYATRPFAAGEQWWRAFDDPLMNELAADLAKQNLDVKIAAARITESRALARQSRAQLYPEISGTGSASRSNEQTPEPASTIQGGLDASWQLDLFGVNRSAARAAMARAVSSAASADDVRNTVIGELLRAVIDWRAAQDRLRETESLLAAQSEQVDLISARVEAGLVDAVSLERARAQRDQTATELPLARASAQTAQYQIERLLGEAPGSRGSLLARQASGTSKLPEARGTLAIPLATLQQRPDVRVAQADLLAASEELRQAERDFWPKLTLSGFFGAKGVDDVLKAMTDSNPIWTAAADLTVPLLDFGRLRAAADAASARETQALLTYENTLLSALQEAATALSDYLNGVRAVEQQSRALTARRQTIALATERFESGLTDRIDITTAQSELDEATLTLITRRAEAAAAYVRLQAALGHAVAE